MTDLPEQIEAAIRYSLALRRSTREIADAVMAVLAEQEPTCWAQVDDDGTPIGVLDFENPPYYSTPLYAKPTPPSVPEITDEMVSAYLSAQAAAVQAVDDMWGSGGKAPSHMYPVREACRAGLKAALLAAAPTPPSVPDGWQLATEETPAEGEQVICCYVGVYGPRIVTYSQGHYGRLGEPDGRGSQPATHWMPLPAAPKPEDAE